MLLSFCLLLSSAKTLARRKARGPYPVHQACEWLRPKETAQHLLAFCLELVTAINKVLRMNFTSNCPQYLSPEKLYVSNTCYDIIIFFSPLKYFYIQFYFQTLQIFFSLLCFYLIKTDPCSLILMSVLLRCSSSSCLLYNICFCECLHIAAA